MIISDLYEVRLTSNKSNLYLDETCTITVKAIDFNGNNINGINIQIIVDDGTFIDGNTNLGDTYTATTGADGYSVTYKATEKGIIGFRCKVIKTLTGLNDLLDGASFEDSARQGANYILGFDQTVDWTGVTVTGATLNTSPSTNCSYGAYCYQLTNASSKITFEKDGCYPLEYNSTTGRLNTITQLISYKPSNFKIRCDGWKRYSISTTQGESPRYLFVNEKQRKCQFSYYIKSQTFTQVNSATKLDNQIIPSAYRPSNPIRVAWYRNDIALLLDTDGSIYYRTYTSNAQPSGEYVRFDWTY